MFEEQVKFFRAFFRGVICRVISMECLEMLLKRELSWMCNDNAKCEILIGDSPEVENKIEEMGKIFGGVHWVGEEDALQRHKK